MSPSVISSPSFSTRRRRGTPTTTTTMTRTKKMKRRRTERPSWRSFANQMIMSDGAATPEVEPTGDQDGREVYYRLDDR